MLHALTPFAVGLVEIVALWGAVALACGAAGSIREWWRSWRDRDRVALEQYAAEQFIREARRQAIGDMLATERSYRDRSGDMEVIESTAAVIEDER
jgi:transposase-like protein